MTETRLSHRLLPLIYIYYLLLLITYLLYLLLVFIPQMDCYTLWIVEWKMSLYNIDVCIQLMYTVTDDLIQWCHYGEGRRGGRTAPGDTRSKIIFCG